MCLCLCRTRQNILLPEPGKYATGILFVDRDAQNVATVEKAFEQLAQQMNLQVCIAINHLLPFIGHTWFLITYILTYFLYKFSFTVTIYLAQFPRLSLISLSLKGSHDRGHLSVQNLKSLALAISEIWSRRKKLKWDMRGDMDNLSFIHVDYWCHLRSSTASQQGIIIAS